MESYKGNTAAILASHNDILPEDDATIYFTSGRPLDNLYCFATERSLIGTTGVPKGVLSTQRMYLTNIFNVCPT